MASNESIALSRRFPGLSNLVSRPGPLKSPEFVADSAWMSDMAEAQPVLVIGAGGLGCEILKDLVMSGVRNIHVIDLDTISLSNLNRQFLFRQADVGKFKAEVAAEFVTRRLGAASGVRITPHNKQIQEYEPSFYAQFVVVICGVDSASARMWINNVLFGLLTYHPDNSLDESSSIPLVDGGTEGFKGHVRVIRPGITPCVQCEESMFPQQTTFPLCTLAHQPRLPEHCVEYVRIVEWEKVKPFSGVPIDGDNPEHIQWVFGHAKQRATEYNIPGVTYRLTQGVIKHIIPAVASTNAAIAAACVTETLKLMTGNYAHMNNFMFFNDTEGVYTAVQEIERLPECFCSNRPTIVNVSRTWTLQQFIDHLTANFDMTAPGITQPLQLTDGVRTLWLDIENMRDELLPNLKKTLLEFAEIDQDVENGRPNHVLTLSAVGSKESEQRMFIVRFTEDGEPMEVV